MNGLELLENTQSAYLIVIATLAMFILLIACGCIGFLSKTALSQEKRIAFIEGEMAKAKRNKIVKRLKRAR